jgi:hypothetical protein
MVPKDNLPGFVKKLVGDRFSFEEHLVREAGSDVAICTITPSALADRAHLSYELRIVPDGENRCRRIMDWTVDIDVFAVGERLEKFAVDEIRRDLDTMARGINARLPALAA